MKKHKLAWGIAYGAMMALMLFNLMRPKSEQFLLVPDDKGSLSRTISERNFTVVVSELDQQILRVSFKPKPDNWDYLFPLALGIAIGIATFRNPPKSGRNSLVILDQRIVTEHSLYPDFVREDSDRAFYSGDELVAVFASWLKKHPQSESKKNTTTEPASTGQPAPHPLVEGEGGENPRPEAEGHPR